jgi:hypothetical protein
MSNPTQQQIDEAADRVAFDTERHRTEEGARLAFAEELARMNLEHEERCRIIARRELWMHTAVALSVLVLIAAIVITWWKSH